MEQTDPIINAANLLSQKLLLCLGEKSVRVHDKYLYYDADNEIMDLGISTPRRLQNTRPGIGWASRAVNTLSDRVVFDGFAYDTFGINDYMKTIGGSKVIQQAKHDAFVGGCAFVMVADDPEQDRKLLVPFTAQEATGYIDQTTGLLRTGLAVTRWSPPRVKTRGMLFAPADYIVFTPEFTAIYINRELDQIVPNFTGRTLLHPLTHRHSANRPLGKSRISNTVRRIIQEVGRMKRREEIAEEFYSLPQRYISGLAEGATKDSNLDSAIGKVWTITKDEDGEKPDIGQLAQMSIDQFETAKKDKARDFCAETSLTLRNLGYETSNPTSAESLNAMSDDLVATAKNSQDEMGEQIKEIAITLRLALDGNNTIPDGLDDIEPAWKPIFPLDVGPAGDSLFKLLTVMPELAGSLASYQMLGISIREAEELQKKRLALPAQTFMQNGNLGGGTK